MEKSFDAAKWKSLLEKRIENASDIDLKRISSEIEYYLQSVNDDDLRGLLAKIGTATVTDPPKVNSPVKQQVEEYPLPKLSEQEWKRLEFRCKFLQMPNLLDPKPVEAPVVHKRVIKPVLFTHKPVDDDGVDEKIKQEQLTEFLGAQASRLLENSKLLNEELQKDSAALTELENEISDRDIKVVSERTRIKEISSSSWSTTLLIYGSILVAVLAFLGAFFYIRIFSVIKIAKAPVTVRELLTPVGREPGN